MSYRYYYIKIKSLLVLWLKFAFNYKVSGRFTKIREDDVFLVSYPKSGNTWMRFLTANLISEDNVNFNNFNSIVPDMYQTLRDDLEKYPSPRIIKSHEAYTKKYPKVIYIFRDPRDVVISFYYWQKKYMKGFSDTMPGFIEKFIQGRESRYGRWDAHLRSWFSSPLATEGRILILKYEDMKEDTCCALRKVAHFLGIAVDDDAILKAVQNSDFKNMQKLEAAQMETSLFFKNSDNRILFVRSGKSEWRDHFTDVLKEKFKRQYGKMLIDLGYERDENW